MKVHVNKTDKQTSIEHKMNTNEIVMEEKLKEGYDQLVADLKAINVKELFSKEKHKNSFSHWQVGKFMEDFNQKMYNERVACSNLTEALSKSITKADGPSSKDFWATRHRFFGISPNGEYNNYPWWACFVLSKIIRPQTREFLTKLIDMGKITRNEYMKRCKDIFELRQIKSLSPSQKSVADILAKVYPDGLTEEELAEKANIGRPSIRGRVTELSNYYGYNIYNKDGKYYRVQNCEEREKQLEKDIAFIYKIKEEMEAK